MKITKQNYPEYFLDYHEGRLPEAARAELMDFLARHPDLKDEFEAFSLAFLEPDPAIAFPGKGSLKRGEVTAENYDWYFAAYVSGDLSPAGKVAVEAFAGTDPRYARELSLMKQTLLQADAAVVFEGKNALKRHVIGLGAAQTAGAAAVGPATAADAVAVGPATGAGVASDAAMASRSVKTRSLFAGGGKLWYYGSAAAVVMIMAGMFFMWGPESSMTGPEPGRPALGYETPAAGLEDQPEAVAEVPPPQQVSSDARRDAVASGERVSPDDVGAERISPDGTSGERTSPAGAGVRSVPPAAARADERIPPADARADERIPPAAARAESVLAMRPLIAGIAPSMQPSGFAREMPHADLQHKTEFAYWDARMVSADALAAGGYHLSDEQISLSQLARNRLQESLPVDRNRAETLVAEGGNSLRDVARSGIGTLERLASSVINPEPLPEEEGRQVQFALGNILRVSRTSSPE